RTNKITTIMAALRTSSIRLPACPADSGAGFHCSVSRLKHHGFRGVRADSRPLVPGSGQALGLRRVLTPLCKFSISITLVFCDSVSLEGDLSRGPGDEEKGFPSFETNSYENRSIATTCNGFCRRAAVLEADIRRLLCPSKLCPSPEF